MDLNDITYQINGAIFEVNRILGPGFLEKVYENAMMVEFKRAGLPAEQQSPIDVVYEKEIVGKHIYFTNGSVYYHRSYLMKIDFV